MVLRRLALAIGVLCGLIGTQGPEFAQQYRQRLAGSIDELSRVVSAFGDEAANRSLTPAEAIARLRANADPLARERGADMESDIVRLERMNAALAAFKESGWRRLAALARAFDATTANRTWKDFEPAVPTTEEALVAGLIGLVWGWGATHICAWPARRQSRRRAERRAAEA
jgi:hypothetical protein